MATPDFVTDSKERIPIYGVNHAGYEQWIEKQPENVKKWMSFASFGSKHSVCVIPDSQGHVGSVLLYQEDEKDFWAWGQLPYRLPRGHYYIKQTLSKLENNALAWAVSHREASKEVRETQDGLPTLIYPGHEALALEAETIAMVRAWINKPPNILTPNAFAEETKKIALACGAKVTFFSGEQLKKGFPAVHTVGNSSVNSPCMINLKWGDPSHPRLGLVGKGVCFDSGGLNIKSTPGMALMKKDMGGAAHVLGLARMIMMNQMPVYLDLWIPAVENAVSERSYRPSDVILTRKGLYVEVGNTDAEGRLILADALAVAQEGSPDLIIDFATLTGSARVALGPDIPAAFIQDQNTLQSDLMDISKACFDPLWPMPLYQPYRHVLKSSVADLHSTGTSSYGGAITAALMLQHFIHYSTPWLHIDLMAWNVNERPGRPMGGEAQAFRAVWRYLQHRFM